MVNDSLEQVPGVNIDNVETQALQVLPLPASVPASPPKPGPMETPSDDYGEVGHPEVAKEQSLIDHDGKHGDDLPMDVDKIEPKETPSSSNLAPAVSTKASTPDDPPPKVFEMQYNFSFDFQA